MAEQTLVARFRKGDIVRWNALALHGDDRNGWTIEGLDEAKGLFPIYRVRKGKQTGSAVQSDLEPCPTHARLQREAQTSGAMAEDLVARLRAGAELQDTQYGWAPGDKLLGEAADELERLRSVALAARALVQSANDRLASDEVSVDEPALTSLEKALADAGLDLTEEEFERGVAEETPAAPPGVMDVLELQAKTDAAVAGLNPLVKCPTCGMGYFKHPMQD